MHTKVALLRPRLPVGVWRIEISLRGCKSVSPLAFQKTACSYFTTFSVHVTCASGDNAITCVLPVSRIRSAHNGQTYTGLGDGNGVCSVTHQGQHWLVNNGDELRYDAEML